MASLPVPIMHDAGVGLTFDCENASLANILILLQVRIEITEAEGAK